MPTKAPNPASCLLETRGSAPWQSRRYTCSINVTSRRPTSIHLLYRRSLPAAHVDTLALSTQPPSCPRRYTCSIDAASQLPTSIRLLYRRDLPAAHVDTVALSTRPPSCPRRYGCSIDAASQVALSGGRSIDVTSRQPPSKYLLYQ